MTGVDLVTFLLERLDEDESAAQRTQPGPWMAVPAAMPGEVEVRHQMLDGRPDVAVAVATTHGLYCAGSDAEHIARYDPARVLAELEAKRAIVAQCAPLLDEAPCDVDAAGADLADDVLRLLALPYAEHSDYQQEWKP